MIGMTNKTGQKLGFYKLVANTEPLTTGDPDTIYINTAVPITDWSYGYNFPANPKNGEIFIMLRGANSIREIELLPVRSLKIPMAFCFQCVSGVWVGKDAFLYYPDSQIFPWQVLWHDLYKEGVYHEGWHKGWDNTGSWSGLGVTDVDASGGDPAHIHQHASGTSGATGIGISNATVDLTGFKTLQLNATGQSYANPGATAYSKFQIVQASTGTVVKSTDMHTIGSSRKNVDIDISSYNYPVKFRLNSYEATSESGVYANQNIYRITLIPNDIVTT